MPPVRPTILTTLKGPHDADWESATDYISPPTRKQTLSWVLRYGWRARRYRAVVVRGTTGAPDHYRDLLLAAAVRFLAPSTRVVVSDATIEPGSRALRGRSAVLGAVAPVLARGLVHLINGQRVTWCVLSRAEINSFPATWRLSRSHVVFTPFAHTLHNDEASRHRSFGSHVFSGGNSLRDHDLLIEAARGIDVDVVIATRSTPGVRVPPNVTVRETGHEEFMELMGTARGVVLCLRESSRSTGQQTYLNAMALGKPVVVTDTRGARDHIEDGVTGYVVPADVTAVRRALQDLADPARQPTHRAVGARAREVVNATFTDRVYRRRLLGIAGLEAHGAATARSTSGVR